MKYLILSLFIFSCSHHGNHANQHMHKKSHAELINNFEDKDRDQWQKPYEVIALMGNLKSKSIIDIGSGSGYFTKYFLEVEAETTAADVDQVFLDFVSSRFQKNSKFTAKKIAFTDPLMGKDSYDYAFTCNTYHHIENRVEYFRKVWHGLKQNGRVVIVDFKKDLKEKSFGPPLEMRIYASQVKEELRDAGFSKVIVDRKLLPYQYVIIGYKE